MNGVKLVNMETKLTIKQEIINKIDYVEAYKSFFTNFISKYKSNGY